VELLETDPELWASVPDWWKSGHELYNGVFEGGGAKGVAYVGALKAVGDRNVWFHRVAGASVGSIIAALIASGLTVPQFRAALNVLRNKFPALGGFRSYARLRRHAAIFDPTPLRTSLESILVAQVKAHAEAHSAPSRPDGQAVTFNELFKATNIELNVLAIDVFDRREVVFTHTSTPDCQVVDAVIASSAIPGFFPPGRLCVRRSDSVTLAHPIVDGGVWANFPLFVFRDDRFRAFHDLEELKTSADRQVMGFLLEESQLVTTRQRRSRYAAPLKTARFWRPGDTVLPAEFTLLADDKTIIDLAELPVSAKKFNPSDLDSGARRAVTSRWSYALTPTAALSAASTMKGDQHRRVAMALRAPGRQDARRTITALYVASAEDHARPCHRDASDRRI
jgi:predicted acylesterase/phospholipase RssA